MVNCFLTVRSHYDRKLDLAGTCYVRYSFNGEKKVASPSDESDKVQLSLTTLATALDDCVELRPLPTTLQIDTDVNPLIKRYIDKSLSEEEYSNYKDSLDQIFLLLANHNWKPVFQKARDHAGMAMVHNARIAAECETVDFSNLLTDNRIVLPGREN